MEDGSQTLPSSPATTRSPLMQVDLPPSSLSKVMDAVALPQRAWTALTIILALFLRWSTALGTYSGYISASLSGYQTPPLHGDYEAQRHWMELTIHMPLTKWYFYDTHYWGLDYPPLTAYISWVFGKIADAINPEWVALHASRGYESYESKVFMRASVLATDLLVYVPAVLAFVRLVMRRSPPVVQQTATVLLLCQPALILIDHGHFQYNHVMLGLSLLSIVFVQQRSYVDAAAAFVMALMFKQMTLYYAPAIFIYILAHCFRDRGGVALFFKVAITVVATTSLMLLPFRDLAVLQQIVHRVFPVARGLYEDKVANIWCAIAPIIKLRNIFPQEVLLRISLATTVAAFTPGLVFLWRKPTTMGLIYAFASTSMSFFLLSFQVHEKTILVPLLPYTLLMVVDMARNRWTWRMWNWMINIGCFSMYPLLKKDGLALQYFCLLALWNAMLVIHAKQSTRAEYYMRFLEKCSYMVAGAIHLSDWLITPPARLPDLWVVLNVLLSCAVFSLGWFMVNLDFWTYSLASEARRAKAAGDRDKSKEKVT
ncbi:Glucosyltransferase-like protein [Sorochytrium milnesiophthora]